MRGVPVAFDLLLFWGKKNIVHNSLKNVGSECNSLINIGLSARNFFLIRRLPLRKGASILDLCGKLDMIIFALVMDYPLLYIVS